jgi:DNA-binding LytR/AlgR family response regulator
MAEQKLYKPNPDAFVYVKADRVMQKVFVNEILYVESWKDYVRLYFITGKFLLIKQPISAIENLLSQHNFLRVHRSYIVSLNKISGYSGICVRLSSTEIPIGRLYKQSVMSQLNI